MQFSLSFNYKCFLQKNLFCIDKRKKLCIIKFIKEYQGRMDCMLNTHKTVARLLSMLLAFFLLAAAACRLRKSFGTNRKRSG